MGKVSFGPSFGDDVSNPGVVVHLHIGMNFRQPSGTVVIEAKVSLASVCRVLCRFEDTLKLLDDKSKFNFTHLVSKRVTLTETLFPRSAFIAFFTLPSFSTTSGAGSGTGHFSNHLSRKSGQNSFFAVPSSKCLVYEGMFSSMKVFWSGVCHVPPIVKNVRLKGQAESVVGRTSREREQIKRRCPNSPGLYDASFLTHFLGQTETSRVRDSWMISVRCQATDRVSPSRLIFWKSACHSLTFLSLLPVSKQDT